MRIFSSRLVAMLMLGTTTIMARAGEQSNQGRTHMVMNGKPRTDEVANAKAELY